MSDDDLADPHLINYDRNCNTTLYQKAQERHIKRYLDPWINVFYPRGDTTPHVSAAELRNGWTCNTTFIPRTSPDINLTAFAQLGSLRLNARRSVISLVGHEDQYVLAEATQTISLQSDTIYASEDDLWLGHCVLPCSVTIGGYAMAKWRADSAAHRAEQRAMSSMSMNAERALPLFDPIIIFDVTKDDHCKYLPTHAIPEHAKFYAAVPIVAHSGHIVGIYEIYDDVSRQEIDPQHLRFLRDMATTVSKHLVAVSARVMQTRGERLVKGLALFMEGKSSLRQWFVEEGHKQRVDLNELEPGDGESISNEATEQYGPEHRQGRSGSHASRNSSATSPASRDTVKATRSQKLAPKGHEHRRSVPSFEGNLSSPPAGDRNAPKKSSTWNGQASTDTNDNEKSDGNLVTQDMRSLFSRASNLIREACGVDGVMVFDASEMSHWKQDKSDRVDRLAAIDGGDTATYSSDGSDSDTPSPSHSENFTDSEKCKILGFSVTAKSSLAGNSASHHHLLLRKNALSTLIKRYPKGKVFHYSHGESLSSNDEIDLKLKPTRQHKKTLHEQSVINQVIGGAANSVAFFPLWDWHRNRWFAGIFAWTMSSSRMLGASDDLPYLKAFGNSIMTELARIDASTADRAKAKFISSISHELRSPLHGILAGAELLLASNPSGFESNLVSTVENCGKTLLDTVNHLLEYSKINSATSAVVQKIPEAEQAGQEIKHPEDDKECEAKAAQERADIEQLTEEVLETLLLGLTSNPAHADMQFGNGHGTGTDLNSYKRFPYIVFDVDRTKPWLFHIPAGAWRRVVMNLVGNSLKFTKKGYVHLQLKHQRSEGRDIIALIVEDTGRGISQEFLRHHLYTPFVQEDILSPGTGLGLHLTRQMVHDLHGKLTASSTLGKGSKFVVELPLQPAPFSKSEDEEKSGTQFVMRERMRDRTVAIITSIPRSADEHGNEGFSLITNSLASLFRDWFDMNVKHVEHVKDAPADLIVMTDGQFQDFVEAKGGDLSSYIAQSTGNNVIRRLMVLCYNLHFAARVSQKYSNIQFVTPPFGTKSISRALVNHFSETLEEGKVHAEDHENHQSQADTPPQHDDPQVAHRPKASSSRNPSHETLQSPKSESGVFETSTTSLARLLLVEDNEINMKFLVTFAKRNNLRHGCAENGLEAVEAYKEAFSPDPFDVIVMDISMPIMDGLTATREIRRFERENSSSGSGRRNRIHRAHIVALTGVASENARQDAFGAGVDLFITKPAPLKRLKEIVEEFVRKREASGAGEEKEEGREEGKEDEKGKNGE